MTDLRDSSLSDSSLSDSSLSDSSLVTIIAQDDFALSLIVMITIIVLLLYVDYDRR
jgi:hypothetical protein